MVGPRSSTCWRSPGSAAAPSRQLCGLAICSLQSGCEVQFWVDKVGQSALDKKNLNPPSPPPLGRHLGWAPIPPPPLPFSHHLSPPTSSPGPFVASPVLYFRHLLPLLLPPFSPSLPYTPAVPVLSLSLPVATNSSIMSRQPLNQGGSVPFATARHNEYFVPRDGIDREVISADICRYLGNDALVRPGHYEVRRAA